MKQYIGRAFSLHSANLGSISAPYMVCLTARTEQRDIEVSLEN